MVARYESKYGFPTKEDTQDVEESAPTDVTQNVDLEAPQGEDVTSNNQMAPEFEEVVSNNSVYSWDSDLVAKEEETMNEIPSCNQWNHEEDVTEDN